MPSAQQFSADLAQSFNATVNHPSVRAIVLAGAGKTFVAGADIREFNEIAEGKRPPLDYYDLLLTIENSRKPVVAALQGSILGGGLELAMGRTLSGGRCFGTIWTAGS